MFYPIRPRLTGATLDPTIRHATLQAKRPQPVDRPYAEESMRSEVDYQLKKTIGVSCASATDG